MTFSVVIYTRKGFFLLDALDEKILQLTSGGLIEYWHSQIIDERFLNIIQSQEPRKIEIDHLLGIFKIWSILCLVAFFVFICEIIYWRYSTLSNLS